MDAKCLKYLVILSLVTTIIAGPIKINDWDDKCSTRCIQPTTFNYEPGTTYVYNYRVDTASSSDGTFEDSAKTRLQTDVHIQVVSHCEFVLRLRNTRLFHSNTDDTLKSADQESEFQSQIEGSPLRFSFQNGVVDSVCAERHDSTASINFKKGILSAFQNGMDDFTQNQNITETDVTGVCKTEYRLVRDGYFTTKVKKVKDIMSCNGRLDYRTMVQSTSYKVPSDLQDLPLMKTNHECHQTINNGGILKSSVCKESHVYRPFANGEKGARTIVTQTLTYQTNRKEVYVLQSGDAITRSPLTFDHSADHPIKEQSRQNVERVLGEICDTTCDDVRPETPRLFSDLVTSIKGLDKNNLMDIHRLMKTKSKCPTNGKAYKYFHDALPMSGTSASVNLMVELIIAKDVTGLEATAWLTSLAFIQNPTTDMLFDVKALLDDKEVREKAMLPVSSMVNNFCKKMGTCNQYLTVLSLVASLERNIGHQCDASGKKFQLVLLTLKAIGNAGHILRAIPTLNKCLTSTSNPLEIRLAAAEAFRRMSCLADNTDLWETFTNKDSNSELRINAYVSLMRCPDESTLEKMAAILNHEEDEQVGSYVYSHLTNLRETSDPHKQEVVQIIKNLFLDKRFELTPFKYSRNFEVSGLLNKINTGITAEGNLIWSNDGQMPRAMSANLTVQLFGQSINLLDFGGRLDGMEYLIKNVLEPYVNSDMKDSWPKNDAGSVKGSVYGRVFGNEIMFIHSKSTKSLFGKNSLTYLDFLIKMANRQHIALTQSVQFLDASMTIPTIGGFPIRLSVNGTATIDLTMSGKMDLRKVGSSPRSMDMDGEIRPSAALEVTGTMAVEMFAMKSGVRMRNTLHTSTAMKGRVQLSRGEQLNVEIDALEKKIEIFDARSKFFIIHNGEEIEQEKTKDHGKTLKYCTSERLVNIFGIELCGEVSFPSASMKPDRPFFPLTGLTSVSATIFKRDSHTGYKLFAKRVENKKASIAQISLDTPGSRTDRAISIDMSINYKKQNFEMNLLSPWKQLAINGDLTNIQDLKSLNGKLVIDSKDIYAAVGEVKVIRSNSKIELSPMVELRRPGSDNVQLTGVIAIQRPMKSFDMEMTLYGMANSPYSMKTAVINSKKEKILQSSISLDGKTDYSVKFSNVIILMGKKSVIAVIKNSIEVKSPERKLIAIFSKIEYRESKLLKWDSSVYIYRILKTPSSFKVNLQKTTRKKTVNYKTVAILKSPLVSGSIVCNTVRNPKGLMSFVSKIDYTIPQVSTNIIILSGKFNNRSTKSLKSYIVQSSVVIKHNPEYNANMKAELVHKRRLSYMDVNVVYGADPKDQTKKIYFMTSLSRQSESLKNAIIKFKSKALAPAFKVDVLLVGKHEHTPKLLDSSLTLTFAQKRIVNVEVTLKDKSTKLARMNGKAIISWPGKEYTLASDLMQKSSKQFTHTLNFKSKLGTKHTIFTTYRIPKRDSYDVVTNFRLHKMKPFTISGASNFNLKTFAASGEFKTGKHVYGFNCMSKIYKSPLGEFSLEIIHPERRVTLVVNGGKNRNTYEGKVVTDWDAGRSQNSKVFFEGGFFHKSAQGLLSLGGNVNFKSPFKHFENLLGSVKIGSDPSRVLMNGKFLWDNRTKQIVSAFSVEKPITLNNLHFQGDIKTPFRGFRSTSVDVTHKVDTALSSVVKGNFEKQSVKLSLQSQPIANGYKADLNLKSTIKHVESLIVSASQTSSSKAITSISGVNYNGKLYAYDMTLSHSGSGWNRTANGDLILTLDKQKIVTHWDHKNSDVSVHSTLRSKWNDKRLLLDVMGSHKLSELRNINGILKIKCPWESVDDIELNINHVHGSSLINSVAFFRQGSIKKASSLIEYNVGVKTTNFDFVITSPFHKDLSGTLNTNYDRFPFMTTTEIKWTPKMKGTLETSLAIPSWDNADFSLKLTTPSHNLRNVVLKASNKRENRDLLSLLNLDFGVRQNIEIKSLMRNEGENKIFRFKVKSPCELFKSLDTGLSFNGHAYKFDTNFDFEILPSIGKFDGAVNWQYDDKIDGKIHLDTPYPDYPYFEMSTSSVLKGLTTKSLFQVEYHPHQRFRIDTTHSFDLPFVFEANVNTPFPEFNEIGMTFQHNMEDSAVNCHGEVKYRPGKKIEADLIADWASNVEGSLVVRTPFPGYETNKIAIKYRGQLDNFDTHGEINVAKNDIILVDTSFKSGHTTTASFTLTSPFHRLKNIDASFRKKGTATNIRGGAVIKYNGQKLKTTFTNIMNKDSLKASVNVVTPFTEAFKVVVDHSGFIESFTNKININYGCILDVDAIASFASRGNNINGNGVFKYNLDNDRNMVRVSFHKSGPIEDFSFYTTARLNKDEIRVSGSSNTKDGIESSVHIATPFKTFKNTGIGMTHSGHLSDFTTKTWINYMDNKNITGNLKFSTDNGVRFAAELTTPFKNIESSSLKLTHDIADGQMSGVAEVTTTFGGFGTGNVLYSMTGHPRDFVLESNVSINGKDITFLKVINKMDDTDLHSQFGFKSVSTTEVSLSVDHTRDHPLGHNTTIMAKFGENVLFSNTNMNHHDYSVIGEAYITYEIHGQGKNKASISLKKEGPLDNCKIELMGNFNDDEAKLSAYTSGASHNMRFISSVSYNGESIDVDGGWKHTDTIEGTLKAITPFDDFKNVGIVLSHEGDVSAFSTHVSLNYIDGKKVTGKVNFNVSSVENIHMSSHLITPFEKFDSLHMKFTNNYNRHTSAINGNVAIDTTIEGFGSGSIAYTKKGQLNNLKMGAYILKNGIEIAKLDIKNNLQEEEVHSSLEYKSTKAHHVLVTLDHRGDLDDLKTSVRALLGDKTVIQGEVSLTQIENTINTHGKLFYNINNDLINQATLNFQKDGGMNRFNAVLTGTHGDHVSKVTCNFKNEDTLTGELSINTPIEGYQNMGLSFKHVGNLDAFNCEGKILLTDSNEFSGKIDFYRSHFQRIETVIAVNTPITDYEFTKFEYRHQGQTDSFTCTSTLQFGNAQRIIQDLSIVTSPNPQITVTLKMPQREIQASGSYEHSWPIYSIKGNFDAGNESSVTIYGSLDMSDDVVGEILASTPVEGFTNVGLNFQHSSKQNGFNTESTLTYQDGKEISGKVKSSIRKNVRQLWVEVTTPFKDFEITRYEIRHVSNKRINKITTELVYREKKTIAMNVYRRLQPHPEISITLDIPMTRDKMEASISIPEDSWPKYELTSKLCDGNGQKYSLDARLDATNDFSGSVTILTPFDDFDKIGVRFIHSGNVESFRSEGTLTLKNNQEISGKINYYTLLWRRLDASFELNTPFIGIETTKAEINFEDTLNSISMSASLEYNNRQKLNGNVRVMASPIYEVLVTVNTPFNDYKIRTHALLDLTDPSYELICSLKYGSKQVYSVNGKLNLYSLEDFGGSVEVNIPLEGFKGTKVEYRHMITSKRFDGSVFFTHDNGNKMGCDIKTVLSPDFDSIINVKTPFKGFETIHATSTWKTSSDNCETSNTLTIGNDTIYSTTTQFKHSDRQFMMSTNVNSPFEKFKQFELTITHDGVPSNFQSTGFLSSPFTDDIKATANFRYDAIFDMVATASVQSSLKDFDDLKVDLKTSEVTGEVETKVVLGWTKGQQMMYEGIFSKQDSWYEDTMKADVSIITTLDGYHKVHLHIDHSAQTSGFVDKVNFEFNDISFFDVVAEYKFDDASFCDVIANQPWPIQISAKMSNYDGTMDVDVFVNWNRNNPDSNVHIQATITDKSDGFQMGNSLDLSVVYASRKVGVVHNFSDKPSQLLTSGYIYWNTGDDNKIAYDIQINEISKRRKQILNGRFQLGLPTRTFGLTGSYSKNAVAVTTDTVFRWDAGRDDSKQIGVKVKVKQGDSLTGTVTVSMPSMNKEININGQVVVNHGRVILDTKTDISYSPDSSKTLTITSKLEDVSNSNSRFNYSLALGMKHPHTNLDVQLSSHMGSSDQAISVGMEANYLTNKRQLKNLALLTEINMLKKKINLRFLNPISNIEVTGDVISENPRTFRLLNKIGDVEAFNSYMTFDTKKKTFSVNASVDTDSVSMSATYPNKSSFRMNVVHHTRNDHQDKASLSVRLNTSRLLHTHLSWRPDVMEKLTGYMLPGIIENTAKAFLVLTSTNEAVAQELSSKFAAISNEIKDLLPFVIALNEELSVLTNEMDVLNELVIQIIGDGFPQLQEKLRRLSNGNKTCYIDLMTSLREYLEEIDSYPIGVRYKTFVARSSEWVVLKSVKTVSALRNYMSEIDQTLQERMKAVGEIKQKTLDAISKNDFVELLASRVSQDSALDLSPFVSSFNLPLEYRGAIQSIVNILQDIVVEEIKEFSEDWKKLVSNPITVWDPQDGEIQADIPLPVVVKHLDEIPDIHPITNQYFDVATFLPHFETWNNLVQTVSTLWPVQDSKNRTSQGHRHQLMKGKNPSRKFRKNKKGRKYKVKRARQ